jgi:hypothetical protein
MLQSADLQKFNRAFMQFSRFAARPTVDESALSNPVAAPQEGVGG